MIKLNRWEKNERNGRWEISPTREKLHWKILPEAVHSETAERISIGFPFRLRRPSQTKSIFCGHNATIYYPLSATTFKTWHGRWSTLRPSALSSASLGKYFPLRKSSVVYIWFSKHVGQFIKIFIVIRISLT